MDLCYENDPLWPVEMFDHVECRIDGCTFAGQVKAIHRNEVTVRYEDYRDTYRTTGNPRVKSRRFDISVVDLVRRDG